MTPAELIRLPYVIDIGLIEILPLEDNHCTLGTDVKCWFTPTSFMHFYVLIKYYNLNKAEWQMTISDAFLADHNHELGLLALTFAQATEIAECLEFANEIIKKATIYQQEMNKLCQQMNLNSHYARVFND